MTGEEAIAAALSRATALAEAVPERYRERAFEIAAHYFLGQTAIRSARGANQAAPPPPPPRLAAPGVEGWVARVIEGLPEPDLIADKGGRAHQTMYAVVSLLEAGQSANTEGVRKYLREKLGITPETGSHTSDRLKSLVPKYLSRDPATEGRGFVYTPTAKALEIFNDLES